MSWLAYLAAKMNASAIRPREDATLELAGGRGLESGLLCPFVMEGFKVEL